MNLSKDLISGQEIGPYKIVFLEYLPKEKGKKRKGKFICPYDNTVFECVVHDVNSGKTRSCGCYKKKNTSRLYKENLLGKWNVLFFLGDVFMYHLSLFSWY